MKILFGSLILLSSTISWGHNSRAKAKSKVKSAAQVMEGKFDSSKIECDEKKELTPQLLARKIEHNSLDFSKGYTGIYQDYENSIRRICEYLKRCEFSPEKQDDQEIRTQYSATTSGKRAQANLEILRKNFRYNSVDYYLFDDHELNDLKNAKVTHLVPQADRTFYLDEQRVVGVFDRTGEEGIFTRYDSNCRVSEIVSFSSLTSFDNPIRIKVNQAYCTRAHNKGPLIKQTDEMLQEMGAYMANVESVEEQMEAQQLCEFWLPKTESIGMVINTTEQFEQPSVTTKAKLAANPKANKKSVKSSQTKNKKRKSSK